MSLTKWWHGIKQSAMEAVQEAEMGMFFRGESDGDRLKDAELCILLKLPVMSTVDNRKMLLGL